MNFQDLMVGACLFLVLEGMLPFLSPKLWKRLVKDAAELNDSALRGFGFGMMVLGTLLLHLLNR